MVEKVTEFLVENAKVTEVAAAEAETAEASSRRNDRGFHRGNNRHGSCGRDGNRI